MNLKMTRKHAPASLRCLLSATALAACAAPCTVVAFEINSGSEDLKMRWDNTVRYNLGLRVKDCDQVICGNDAGLGDPAAFGSDRKFGSKGDVVTNRLDLLTEFDLTYKENTGFRVSAAGWYDQAYHNTRNGQDAALGGGQEYTHYIKRYNRGPSGELLDAFVFARVNLGSVPVSIKAGQHNIYWGESLFSLTGGVAMGQGPLDIRKAAATPGVEAKEVFKPLTQLSASAALTDRLSVAGQYFLDWKPTTLPDGGTYFGPADFFTVGGGTSVFGVVPFNGATDPRKKRGEWGVSARWRPEWLDGSAGIYYREYTSKLPQLVFDGSSVVMDYRAPRSKMIAFSLAKQIAGISFGSDVTFRRNEQLAVPAFTNVSTVPFPLTGAMPVVAAGAEWRPRGDVFTGLVNAIAYFGKNALFDSAALTGEINYQRLQKVTFDPYGFYFGLRGNCPVPTDAGCPTRSQTGIAVSFEPKWFQVLQNTDISVPMFWGQGLRGNSVVGLGDNQGQGSYSIGVSGDMDAKYNFSLKYNGFIAKHSADGTKSNASLGKNWDRDWVSFTFKTTF